MAGSRKARRRGVEKTYPKTDFIAKLRRLAGALERDERFSIQVAGRRIVVPRDATVGVEHEGATCRTQSSSRRYWGLAAHSSHMTSGNHRGGGRTFCTRWRSITQHYYAGARQNDGARSMRFKVTPTEELT